MGAKVFGGKYLDKTLHEDPLVKWWDYSKPEDVFKWLEDNGLPYYWGVCNWNHLLKQEQQEIKEVYGKFVEIKII